MLCAMIDGHVTLLAMSGLLEAVKKVTNFPKYYLIFSNFW